MPGAGFLSEDQELPTSEGVPGPVRAEVQQPTASRCGKDPAVTGCHQSFTDCGVPWGSHVAVLEMSPWQRVRNLRVTPEREAAAGQLQCDC